MKHDVAIIGGGMVGATLACAIGELGLRVAIVEAHPARADPAPANGDLAAGFDLRVSALTRASERLLERYGVWDGMPPGRMGPFREMRVWDATGPGAIHFDSADMGESTLGYIVENRLIHKALEERLGDLDTVQWFRPASLEGLIVGPDSVLLQLRDSNLEARLVVGADGTQSQVRALTGMPYAMSEYNQCAVVATVRTELNHQETAWQRFLPSGPLAFLPLPAGYSSIVWSTTPAQAQNLLELEKQEFRMELECAFDSRLGAVTWIGERAAFPLRRLHAHQYVRHRVALIGDAAHTIHPLAGQGVNLGLLDAAALAEVIEDAYNRDRDPGNLVILRRYERWRKGHNLAMLSIMDGFRWLFGSKMLPVWFIRNLGLSATDRLRYAKRLIMKHAMGLAGDLPAAARGWRGLDGSRD